MCAVGGDNPFQDLFAKAGIEGTGEPEPDPAEVAASEPIRAVVLAFEKRNGRPLTTVRDLPPGRRAETLAALKKAFACGGSEQDELLLLQGDLRAKAAAWFEKQGIKVRGTTR